MTIRELKKRRLQRRDGQFKSEAVGLLHLGQCSFEELCLELKIHRTLLRQWLRWDYRRRVLRFTHQGSMMQKESKETALGKRILELEKELELERLRREGLEIMLDIGKEKYGLDLRKKPGAKPSKGWASAIRWSGWRPCADCLA